MKALPIRVADMCQRLSSHGLRPLIVGGAVIDLVRGKEPKDWDIEVYGASMEDLERILIAEGFAPKTAGKAFGILVVGHMDISVPRKDNQIGKGHKGFEVEFDPSITPAEGALRRDFTINSMYFDVSTGEIVDPCGGLEDLEKGILRATDPLHFVEDPLRALRAMQLLARKARTVEPATMALIQGMVNRFHELAPERVLEELRKLLLLADKPSVGLEFLRESGWIAHFPMLKDLIGCAQKPKWHPEGDVWEHTKLVVDAAAALRNRVPEDWQDAFMFAALLHDIGKPATTTPELTSHGHDVEGSQMARWFLHRLRAGSEMTARVVTLVGCHMQPLQLLTGGAKESAFKRLHNRCRLDVLAYLSHADRVGSNRARSVDDDNACLRHYLKLFERFGEQKIAPVLMGRHLISAGLSPGPLFGERLDRAYELQLDDPSLGVDELLARVL